VGCVVETIKKYCYMLEGMGMGFALLYGARLKCVPFYKSFNILTKRPPMLIN
jgi:hypothetical protein